MTSHRLVVAVVLLAGAGSVAAYNDIAHDAMSRAAVENSVLANDASLLPDLGLPPWSDYATGRQSQDLIRDAVARGGYYEDRGINSRNHFFNPLTGEGFTHRGGGSPSPVFALEAIRDAGGTWTTYDLQPYSFRHARQDFLVALTFEGRLMRDQFWKKTWEDLGHVIHHLQDMAQPQHVRDDDHLSTLLPDWILGESPSAYEAWAEDNWGVLIDAYPPVSAPTPQQLWTTYFDTSVDFANNNGMVDFSRDADGVWRIASM
ncbi:MAG: hypothetical protein U0807_08615 [Candidatus Binatia bacterium]